MPFRGCEMIVGHGATARLPGAAVPAQVHVVGEIMEPQIGGFAVQQPLHVRFYGCVCAHHQVLIAFPAVARLHPGRRA